MSEPEYIVAGRVIDHDVPYVSSVMIDCKDCGLACYVSETTFTIAPQSQVICLSCFAGMVEQNPELIQQVELHPRILAEAGEALQQELSKEEANDLLSENMRRARER